MRAVSAAYDLADLNRCTDAESLAAEVPLPSLSVEVPERSTVRRAST